MHYEQYENDRLGTQLSRALGWFSVALGAAELLAPQQMARLIGVQARDRTRATLRAFGAREMATGIAILAEPEDAKWLWSRVGGDALDLATLTSAAADEGTNRGRLAFATAAVMGVAALDVLCAQRLSTAAGDDEGFGAHLEREQAVTIRSPLEEVEAGWVKWCASGYARLKNNYAVRFEPAPGARGTEMHLAGGGSKGTVRQELRRFKQLMETGEIPVSEGPGLWRPAQPPDDAEQLKHTAGVL
jgi:uncharacterized membrane protein